MYEQTITFINSLVPTKLETIVGGGVALVGVIMQHLFGAFSETFETLLILMTIDYITGISAACINPNMQLDSRKCGTGALKKVGREGLSILENAANCGLPIPQKLKDTLAQFTEFKKNR